MSYSKVSKDEFLGGLLTLKQPIKGYRITSDSIFLAASISVKKGEKILDVGAGTGAILSFIAARLGEGIKTLTLHGVEIQDDLIALARENGPDFISYFNGNIFRDIDGCKANCYDHVISNPPYYEKGKTNPSPYKTKAVAQGGDMVDLDLWIERSMRMVRPKGYLTVVHRADRLGDIVKIMSKKAGAIIIYPLYSKVGKDANRVIIRAQKDANGPLTLKSGMVVHKCDGSYSDEAEDILRRVHYLDITK